MSKVKVLLAASEVAPFAKTGGLADIAGSLPKALKDLDVDIRVVMPKYKNVPNKFLTKMKNVGNSTVNIVFKDVDFEIYMLEEDNVTYYFIGNDSYYCRDGYYGYPDDGERFAFFSRAILEMLPLIGFKPDIIHSNDWQTGVLSTILRSHYALSDFHKNIRTVFSIHNMKYQGVFPKVIMDSLLYLSWDHFKYEKLEFHDQVNYLKAGIAYSDVVNTVSKAYSDEIKHDFFAENLGGMIRSRSNDLYGILNGIDYNINNPSTDKKIFANFNSNNLSEKYINKKMLQQSLGLPVRSNVPVISIISRLVDQKGFDLIGYVLNELLELDIQLVILGTGEYRYEEMFKYYSHSYPNKVSTNILYDDVLAQRIYAGSDMFLMPSLFEPCGLSQMISLRYGTIPIVRETGGLKDTIIPYNKYTKEGNGFSFTNYNAHDMLNTIKFALEIYNNTQEWTDIVLRGMKQDFSWQNSAKEYLKMYENVLKKDIHHP